MRTLVAVLLILGSVVGSLLAITPLFITWAEVVPAGITFDVGDAESVTHAVIRSAGAGRESVHEACAPSIYGLATALMVVTTAFAVTILRGKGATTRERSWERADAPTTARDAMRGSSV